MKRKVVTGLLMLVMITGLAAGCGKKKIDYGFDEDNSEVSSEGGSSLAEFREAEKWSEEWLVKDEAGREKKVTVDAEVVVPDFDRMVVTEVERMRMNEEFREQFRKAFFGNEEMYYYDEAHWPKARVQEIIAELEAQLGQWDEETNERIEDEIRRYQGIYEAASEDYTVAEDFTTCNSYAGYRDGVLYIVSFSGDGDTYIGDFVSDYIRIEALNAEDVMPEELRGYDEVLLSEPRDIDNNQEPNACSLSAEEARGIADSFMSAIGRSDAVCTLEQQAGWYGMSWGEDGSVSDENSVLYGYTFNYGIGTDGAAFSQFPHYAGLDAEWKDEPVPGVFFGGDVVGITVTDAGITSVNWCDPVDVRDISDPVELLPLNTIKNIIENEVFEHYERYDFKANVAFTKLQLIYLSVRDEANEGVYSYVPVWHVTRSDGGYPILVNAMDGSILYVLDISQYYEE